MVYRTYLRNELSYLLGLNYHGRLYDDPINKYINVKMIIRQFYCGFISDNVYHSRKDMNLKITDHHYLVVRAVRFMICCEEGVIVNTHIFFFFGSEQETYSM